jgi:hypothetical protein
VSSWVVSELGDDPLELLELPATAINLASGLQTICDQFTDMGRPAGSPSDDSTCVRPLDGSQGLIERIHGR